MDNSSQKAFVVFNPKAGKEDPAEEVRAALARHFTPPQWTSEIYETTGQEDVAAICRAACARGASLVISAGGDGTLVGVGNGLVNSPVPLGILPLGTGNDLARILLIPLKLDEAMDLLVSDHAVMEVDALQVGERHFFSNVSVGISPEVMNDTSSAVKKHLGRLAYIISMIKRSSVFQIQRYTLTLDGQPRSIRAAEVLISNSTLLEKPPFLFGPPETLDDGQLGTVCRFPCSRENRPAFLELKVAPEDLGKVIGKQGRTARAIRIILGAAGMKLAALQSRDH